MLDLMKLLPEGASVIAVIIVVILFLRQQRAQDEQNKAIASTFEKRVDEVVTRFQGQIDRITQQVFEYERNNQAQIQRLFDSFIQVSKETIQAVVELKSAVEGLARKIDKNSKRRDDDEDS